MGAPLISVVIPIYNPTNLFKHAIHSVLHQSFDNFEVVISDDSVAELNMGIQDKRVKYVRNASNRRGIFSNLNNAIRNSSGRFIQIFCQDDVMNDNFLEEQVKVLQLHPEVGMVFSSYNNITEKAEDTAMKDSEKTTEEIQIHNQQHFINLLLVHGCIPGNLSPVMFRRDVFQSLGDFNVKFKFCGDFEYWLRLGKVFPVAYNPSKLLSIRTHAGQASVMLPSTELIQDLVDIYGDLMNNHSIKLTNNYLAWYLNERLGVQLFYRSLKKFINSGQWSELKSLRLLRTYPFNLNKILFLFILTLRNYFKLFRITANDLK